MKFYSTCIFCCLCFGSILVTGQELTQSVKGKITDAATGAPIAGVSVVITQGGKNFSGSTNDNGNYSVDLPVGRYKIQASITGYEVQSHELLVISGRQAVINFSLIQKTEMLREVEITAAGPEGDVPGLRTLTIEKTLRFPANFLDPVRVATAYPGVIAANDQNNSIIVRGNSPTGLLWRLNGLDIVNPNHLANAGTLSDKPAANGGGVNILSAQTLDRTNFYTGAFPSRYGNALAGIIDMKLREGDKSKFEYTAQASLIGMDLAAEGPIGKKQNTSFLANYRYSTVGLLSKMGVNFGDEAITFQDFSFNLDKDLAKGGKLSMFGMFGNSVNKFDHKEQKDWREDKDRYDIDYSSNTVATGFNYSSRVSSSAKITVGLAYSDSDQERTQTLGYAPGALENILVSDVNKFGRSIVSSLVKLDIVTGENNSLEVGTLTNYEANNLYTENWVNPPAVYYGPSTSSGILLQPFINWNMSVSKSFQVHTGLHYIRYTYNNTDQLEPRVQLTLLPSVTSSVDLSYNLVSQTQQAQLYIGNKNLDLTKAHHLNLNYTTRIGESVNLKTGVFYQQLFSVPISSPAFAFQTFSALNVNEPTSFPFLSNNGKGRNYGIDATAEKNFFGNHYFMIGGSYYESKYSDVDGVERDTRFNGKYTFTSVYGKEWTKASKNRTIGLSARMLYLGGMRVTSIDETASRNSYTTIYDNSNPFNEKLKDYFRLDLRLNFRRNKPKYTRTFAIDIQNLTSQQNEAYRYYDFVQQKIVTKFQLGIIPILVYRIDF